MDTGLLYVFHIEVERQARFGLIAANDMDAALAAGDIDRLWYSVQSLLIAAGNVSKLLWPSKPLVPDRGEQLRTSLGVTDSSPLTPRRFRNHFEHFDERLECWARFSERRIIADSNVGPTGMIAGLDPSDCLRNFDTKEYAVTFRGDTYSLRPVVDALRALYAKAFAEARRLPWEE